MLSESIAWNQRQLNKFDSRRRAQMNGGLGGAGMRLTPAEKREIALAYLDDPDLGTISACATHFRHTREAVAG